MKGLRFIHPASTPLLLIAVIATGTWLLHSTQAWSEGAAKTQPPGMAYPLSVALKKSEQKRAGIVTAPLSHVSHVREIEAYGTVLSLQGLAGLGKSHARASAQVENAKTRLELSRVEYARRKALYTHNQISSLKNLQLAESAWNQDKVNLRTARAGRQSLTGIALQQWGEVISGWVFHDAPIYAKLIDQQELLVQVTLPIGEKIAAMPRVITIQTAGRSRLKADFVSPAPRTDPQIQGVSYFYMVSSRAGQVQSGMNVTAFLPAGPPIEGFIVPTAAVVWQAGQPLVFVQTDGQHFAARPVATTIPLWGGYLVTSGIAPGEGVVVDGAQTLLSEALLSGGKAAVGGGGDDD
ncbi:MAG: hypothetical protein P4L43_15875 [Syntrophobacteraceae bacterium]|nr:hypothetical protein [Syntrophobacteraceae bacterium]